MDTRQRKRTSRPDAKARMVSIFVGAVLLPSVALSVLSLQAVPKQAEVTRFTLRNQADRVLKYIEQDLERTARQKAQEAAHAVGAEILLEGRLEAVRDALCQAGLDADAFDMLRLEASSPAAKLQTLLGAAERDDAALKDARDILEPLPPSDDAESLLIGSSHGQVSGILHYRLAREFAYRTLVRDYFDTEFSNPDMVIRVIDPRGGIVYENQPTPSGREFEVKRIMTTPSFGGLRLLLRYRDRSIQEEVRRWELAKMATILFIDVLLGAGLLLVYSNVRRELQLARLKSDFVANVSHELKTPLALIRLFAETLELGRVPGEQKAREYYHVINKESQRLTQLINNVLDFSRIEAGRREYRFELSDVGEIVRDVLEAYRYPIEQQGFILETAISDDLPAITADKEALSQALVNLINNGIKYSRDVRFLRVTAERDGANVQLAVTDRGIGIARSEQRKIFEKFYRAEDSLVHETKGSGLGLALVRHIMEAHGGKVEVESAPGKGSTFTLFLPIRARGEEQSA